MHMNEKNRDTSKNTTEKQITYNEICDIVSKNIKTLITTKGINQARLAEITGSVPATVSYYATGKKLPTLDFLWALRQHYGISIDDFLTKELHIANVSALPVPTEHEKQELREYSKFCGTYYLYYLDTSKYKGRDFNSAETSVMYGVLHIYNERSVDPFSHGCIAVLGIHDFEKAKEIKTAIDHYARLNNRTEMTAYIDSNYKTNSYFGNFSLNSTKAFLSLEHETKDKALLILHRVPFRGSHYLGGIGTINSVSRGRESMPVIQFLGLSRYELALSPEEIHYNLLLNYPNFKATQQTNELVQLFKQLYMNPDTFSGAFSEEQKALVIQGNLERYIRESLQKNVFRYGKISNRDDDSWYHAIKAAMPSEYLKPKKL